MSVITILSFRSTCFIMDLSYLTGKKHESPILLIISKDSFFFNLLAVIYDKKFSTRISRSM